MYDLCGLMRSHINNVLMRNPEAASCLRRLEETGDLCLFGGMVRDVSVGKKPRDYDIVIDAPTDAVDNVLKHVSAERNRFGGYRVRLDRERYDIWSLESTWAFREQLVQASVSNLVDTVFFNYDAIVVNVSSRVVYNKRYLKALESGVLDIVLRENPYPGLCVLRAFVIKNKASLRYSPRLEEYIIEWLNATVDPIDVLWSIQDKHYGTSVLSRNVISHEISSVRKLRSNNKPTKGRI